MNNAQQRLDRTHQKSHNAHQKLYGVADDLDQRADALHRLARDLRHLLEVEIGNSAGISDRPGRGATRRATRGPYPNSEPTAVLKLVARRR